MDMTSPMIEEEPQVSKNPFKRLAQQQMQQKNEQRAQEIAPQIQSKNPFKRLSAQTKMEEYASEEPEEGFWKNALRTLYQIPSGIAQGVTYPLDLLAMQGVAEATDPEELSNLRRAHERLGIPFDEEEYLRKIQEQQQYLLTQGNVERGIEEATGLPLTPQTRLQKGIKFASTAGKLAPKPGTFRGMETPLTKPVLGTGVELAKEGLVEAGVPEPFADIASFAILKQAPVESTAVGFKDVLPSVKKETKPSGMITRRYEKITEPTEISGSRIAKIDEKIEREFRNLSDKIIEEAPIEKTYKEYKANPAFEAELDAGFDKVDQLAESIQQPVHTDLIRQKLADRAVKRQKGTGYKAGEYDKDFAKFVKETLEETPSQEVSASDVLRQFRKNNKELRQAYDPSRSANYNEAKRDALLEHNRAIVDVFEDQFPGSEFVESFKKMNEEFGHLQGAKYIDEYVNNIFEGKINYREANKIFNNKKLGKQFERALGKEGYKNFQQLVKDLISTENPRKMLKVAAKSGWEELAKNALSFMIEPKLGYARAAYKGISKTLRKAWEATLDKPQIAVKWSNAIDSLKKGNFAKAEKEFSALKAEVLEAEKETPKAKTAETIEVEPIIKGTPETAPETAAERKQIPYVEQKEKSESKAIKNAETESSKPQERQKAQSVRKELDEVQSKSKGRKSAVKKDKEKELVKNISDLKKELESIMTDKSKTPAVKKMETRKIKDKIKNAVRELGEIRKGRTLEKEFGKPEISPKSLNKQKQFILDKVDKALENPSDKAQIVIDVPDDGIFRVDNSPYALNEFRKRVEKKWPKGSKSEFTAEKNQKKFLKEFKDLFM